jgi:tetraacyldisaccharide 4'-kinase
VTRSLCRGWLAPYFSEQRKLSNWRLWLNRSNPRLVDRAAWWLLRVGCIPYCLVMWIRNRLYDWRIKRVHVSQLPVISVGNLSVGGTGKSPTVAWIARWFRQRDLRVAILSRGYGQLDDGRNDEALELELKLPDVPHLQNKDRVAAAQLATEELEMQLLVLDDGFQHRRLARSLDIVLIDATDSAASQWPLPAGLRREPLSSLERADLVIVTRADMVEASRLDLLCKKIQSQSSQLQVVTASHRPKSLLQFPSRQLGLNRLAGTKVLAFCGIGNPEAFFESLRKLGAELLDTRAWPDHHAYSLDDIQWITNWHQSDKEAVLICTVKDWVKIQEAEIEGRSLLALEIEMELLDGAELLEARLQHLLDSPINR